MNKITAYKIYNLLKNKKHMLIISLLLSLIVVASTLIVPYLFGISIDYMLDKNNVNFGVIYRNITIITSLVFINIVAQWSMSLINHKITYEVVKDLRNQAFSKFSMIPLAYIDKTPSGQIINTIITDTEQFGDGLLMALTQFFTGVMTILGVIGMMVFINIWISLFVVILTPLSLFVAKFISQTSYNSFKAQSNERGKQTAIIDEMITNQKAVQAYRYEDDALKIFAESNESLAKTSLKAIFVSSLVNPSTRFINSLIYAGVALIGGLLATTNTNFAITVGELTCLLGYANQYTKPFNEITGVITELQNALACIEKVFAFLEEENETQQKAVLSFADNHREIQINDLCFSYQKDKPLIQNFNLEVNAGEKIAIVGPTGCGKTTIINLLMRFYDGEQGEIKINNQRIVDYSRESLRNEYGMVLQETWLKNGTIKDNLTLGKKDATLEEIIAVCQKVKIYHFISQLPQGFDTVISDNDSSLSTGEKQLLCIARVMLAQPKILILDEATSNIDTRTEKIVQKAFDELMKDKTSFVVAHRLSTIKNANKIVVMEKGQIIEIGNHQELLAKKGFYYQLYHSQFQH